AAVYLLWAYQRVFHGEPDEANAATPDLSWADGLVLAPLLAAIVFLGVYPKPMLDRIEPSVDKLISHIEHHSDYRQPAVQTSAAHRGAFTTAAGAITIDGFSVFFVVVICLGIALAALLADDYLRRENLDGPELYVLLLLSGAGGIVMAMANDLIVVFLGLETL